LTTRSEVERPGLTGGTTSTRFREAVFADHPQIARLESRYGLAPKPYDAWRGLWLGNPAFRALHGNWPIGWVLEDGDGQIVASMGNIPLAYELDGRPLLAVSGHSWVAEPAHRSASLLLQDHVVNQPGVDLYVNNTVSAASAAAVQAFDCVPVPVGRWDRAGVWYTHRQRYYELRLRQRHVPGATPLSYLLSAPVRLKDRLLTRRLDTCDVEVTACPAFDDRFDEFWAELRARNPHRLLAVRTREMLEWHYRHAALDGRLWIGIVADGARLVAFATFVGDERPVWGTRVRLVDFQSLDGGATLLPPLLSWALDKAGRNGIHAVEVLGRWLGEGEPLAHAAPHPQQLPTWKFVYRANTPALATRLTDPAVWAPSLYDGDSSL